MKTMIPLLALTLLFAAACGDGEVTAYYNDDHRWLAGDTSQGAIEGAEDDAKGDSAVPAGGSEPSEQWQGGTTSQELLNIEGDVLWDALDGGEVAFSSTEPFDTLEITWRGSAETLVLVTDGPQTITSDFAQRGAFDAVVELDRPTSSASIRADSEALTFLRVTAIRGDTQPNDGEDR